MLKTRTRCDVPHTSDKRERRKYQSWSVRIIPCLKVSINKLVGYYVYAH